MTNEGGKEGPAKNKRGPPTRRSTGKNDPGQGKKLGRVAQHKKKSSKGGQKPYQTAAQPPCTQGGYAEKNSQKLLRDGLESTGTGKTSHHQKKRFPGLCPTNVNPFGQKNQEKPTGGERGVQCENLLQLPSKAPLWGRIPAAPQGEKSG